MILVKAIIFFLMSYHCNQKDIQKILKESWKTYKVQFIQKDGRVLDKFNGNITTSEGQAYAMFRAVLANDKTTYYKVLNWTLVNLREHRGDWLFAWKWGKDKSGNWGVLDSNSAGDADQLIAFDLILGYKKWHDDSLIAMARRVLDDIWVKEVAKVGDWYYILPGEWARDMKDYKINPSYFLPFAYPYFQKLDSTRPWDTLIVSTYRVLDKASTWIGLPVNWAFVNSETGEIYIVDDDPTDNTSDFGFDAVRVFQNVYLDYHLFKRKAAISYLYSQKWLVSYWKAREMIPAEVTVYGFPRKNFEAVSIYGGVLPAIYVIDKRAFVEICKKKILKAYKKGIFGDPKDYYAQNLVWFSLALIFSSFTLPLP